MELLKKYPKLFQWLFLLIVFFALCFAIDVPETYKFIRGQAEFVKDPNQRSPRIQNSTFSTTNNKKYNCIYDISY